MKIVWFDQKYNARRLCIIFRKSRKISLRLDKCHEIPKFSAQIKQIHDFKSPVASKNQCERFFMFFHFSKSDWLWKGFLIKSFKKTTSNHVFFVF